MLEQNIEFDLINRLMTGNAILFVGAGFSRNAKNINGDDEIPLSEDLAKIIGTLGNFDDEKDLKYASDYFLNQLCFTKPELKDRLIQTLKDTYTISEVNDDQINVLKIPWKRIYTTNYDDVVEIAARKLDIRIESKDIDDAIDTSLKDKVCIHLNGLISKLDKDTINGKFKLSQSSYLSPESFIKSDWNYIFNLDLELSSAIIFLGYSLYDIEIEKILFDNPNFKQKTYFIQRNKSPEKRSKKQEFLFNKYGKSLYIGIEGFSSLILQNLHKLSMYEQEFHTEAFTKYTINDSNIMHEIRESDVESFLKYGDISQNHIEFGMSRHQEFPFLIDRDKINQAKEFLTANNNICIYSELGNGKSIFLRELAFALTIDGGNVYILTNPNGNYLSDLDKFSSHDSIFILIIDNYHNYDELMNYLSLRKPNNVKTVLTERTSNHHSMIKTFQGFTTKDINIDTLQNDEIEHLAKILEHTSLWGEQGELTWERKINYITDKCRGQLSLTLISLLRSKQIHNAISKLLVSAFRDDSKKLNVFTVCLLDIMNIPISLSLIADLTKNDRLMSEFTSSLELRNLFYINFKEESVDTKSSIYSLFLLNEQFDPSYIIDKCLFILEELEKRVYIQGSLDHIRDMIRINLFRFNFIEQLLPLKTKTGMLVTYFEKIKTKLPRHIDNPQYWLQYAMAHIAMKNYDKANRLLQSAYDKAKYKSYYDVHKINNQQARLNIKIASLHITNIQEAIKLFIDADNLLAKHDNDIYKFKIVNEYKVFYDERKSFFNKEQKAIINIACKNRLKDLGSLNKIDSNFKQEKIYGECEANLNFVISQTG